MNKSAFYFLVLFCFKYQTFSEIQKCYSTIPEKLINTETKFFLTMTNQPFHIKLKEQEISTLKSDCYAKSLDSFESIEDALTNLETSQVRTQFIQDQLDSIEMLFEKHLHYLKEKSKLDKKQTCFICFNMEEVDVVDWLETRFVNDLCLFGIKPIFSPWDLNCGDNLDTFQERARNSDLVVIACTPMLMQKCQKRKDSPFGAVQEVAMIKGRFNDAEKKGKIFPIFLKGSRKEAMPSPYFEGLIGTKFPIGNETKKQSKISYYCSLFELFSSMENIPRKEARKQKKIFIEESKLVLRGKIDITTLEKWRKEKTPKPRAQSSNFLEIPPLPKNFTGRANELLKLCNLMKKNERVAITGLGGMGKTTLALKYAQDYCQIYKYVHFIKSETIAEDFLELARRYKICNGRAKERLDLLKKKLFDTRGSYLIIVDGIDEKEKFEELETYLPLKVDKVLLTTRRPQTSQLYNYSTLRLAEMENQDAVEFILNETYKENAQDALLLSNKLGNFPLALAHASRYIKNTGINISTYLTLFDQFIFDLFSESNLLLRDQEKTILTTWKISIDQIVDRHKCTVAKKLLHFFSFLADTDIPRSFIYFWAEKNCENISKIDLLNGLSRLADYSLIANTSINSYDQHTLVKNISRYHLSENDKQTIILSIFYAFYEKLNKLNMQIFDNRSQIYPLIPHIQSILMHSADYLKSSSKFSDDYHFLSKKLFYYFIYRGEYQNALFYQKKLLKILKENYGMGNVEVAHCLVEVGSCFGFLTNHVEALDYKIKALNLYKKLLGEENRFVGRCLADIGITLAGGLGRYEEALDYEKNALNVYTKLYGENHHIIARRLHCSGIILNRLNRHNEALEIQTRALALTKKTLGAENIDVVISLHNIAITLGDLGRYEEALDYEKKAYEFLKKIVGDVHPFAANCLHNIGITYGALGKHEDALRTEKKALEIRRKFLGVNHPHVLKTSENIRKTMKELNLEKIQLFENINIYKNEKNDIRFDPKREDSDYSKKLQKYRKLALPFFVLDRFHDS